MKKNLVLDHDVAIFYANDCKLHGWYHKDAPAKPYTKGEGTLLMVRELVLVKFGWLQTCDGKKSTHITMKPGKN